ncbi:MAG: 3-hydroxybutyryl-CoA dehydrogenase [Lachnospiraceae bacterium]|nr:3-hydroxybutyryl-CoA dehydrogenase [Lachnospiraceae bacterium]
MKVGVIGAGTMGSGIAQAFAMTDGYEVCLCDIKLEFAEGGLAKIKKNLNFLVGKEKLTQEKADEILGKITIGLNDICGDCDLIIEVALEKMEIKQGIFKELQGIVKKDCIFASNTSSLSITKIGEGLDRPMIGMHFFNPADRMKLVEVIKGENTPQEMVDQIKKISEDIGKTPVEVNEAPGFVVNRILVPMINEAIGVLDAGTASASDIDVAMQLGASHPMGPLHLADLIGLDICLAIMEVLHTETGDDKYAPQPLLKKMVEEKKLGRKSGVGFFDYSK